MAERVLITTHALETAVRLKEAFAAHKLPVELLTPSEEIADVEDPALLVLTGGLDGKRARRLAVEAARRDRLPVMGIAPSPDDAPPSLRARLGLVETFVEPIDHQEVARTGRRLIERRRLREITGIVGETDAMLEVLERITQMAPVNSNVLITGESGTGKELVARGLHALSPRRHRPFIAANVAALTDTLLESELFGHEKGAFTGAVAQRKGFFELADKGTLFLDEIGEMPMPTQSKLLRVLEQREFMRVGGEQPIRVNVRVVAATNRKLRQQVELGEFRRDLYYRLNVLNIELPPLRERREDIPLLVNEFIRVTSEEHDLEPVEVSPEAMALLIEHDWPGNIRELRNLVESVVVMMPGRTITPADIPPPIRGPGASANLPAPVMPPAGGEEGEGSSRPALEFIFRMLLQLRMDVEDLKSGFEDYRRKHPVEPAPLSLPYAYREAVGRDVSVHDQHGPDSFVERDEDELDELDEERVVVFRPGMSMRDLEREAITAALKEVGGNRREAAEALGIGERTLYRKIKEYEIPL
ncbi:MAG: sigma-54 interaction domain-containing protein [Gemmatimonadota bacterium]